jgi:hypothetical protein
MPVPLGTVWLSACPEWKKYERVEHAAFVASVIVEVVDAAAALLAFAVAVFVIVPVPELAENVKVYETDAPAASVSGKPLFAFVHVIVVVPLAVAAVQPDGELAENVSVGAVLGNASVSDVSDAVAFPVFCTTTMYDTPPVGTMRDCSGVFVIVSTGPLTKIDAVAVTVGASVEVIATVLVCTPPTAATAVNVIGAGVLLAATLPMFQVSVVTLFVVLTVDGATLAEPLLYAKPAGSVSVMTTLVTPIVDGLL